MPHRYHLQLLGVSCAGCVRAIEDRFKASGNVASATFDLPGRTVVVHSNASRGAIIELIRDAGYDASPEEVQA